MRFFDEEDDKSKSTIVLIEHKDAEIILEAMEEFVKNNKRKVKAKNLLSEMNKKWNLF